MSAFFLYYPNMKNYVIFATRRTLKVTAMATSKKYLTTGFRPIPMIFGAEGRRFMERAKNPPRLSKDEMDRINRNYEIYKAAEERGRLKREERIRIWNEREQNKLNVKTRK